MRQSDNLMITKGVGFHSVLYVIILQTQLIFIQPLCSYYVFEGFLLGNGATLANQKKLLV